MPRRAPNCTCSTGHRYAKIFTVNDMQGTLTNYGNYVGCVSLLLLLPTCCCNLHRALGCRTRAPSSSSPCAVARFSGTAYQNSQKPLSSDAAITHTNTTDIVHPLFHNTTWPLLALANSGRLFLSTNKYEFEANQPVHQDRY